MTRFNMVDNEKDAHYETSKMWKKAGNSAEYSGTKLFEKWNTSKQLKSSLYFGSGWPSSAAQGVNHFVSTWRQSTLRFENSVPVLLVLGKEADTEKYA